MANPTQRTPDQERDQNKEPASRLNDPAGERGSRQQEQQSDRDRDRNAQQGGQSGQGQRPRDPQDRNPQR